MNIDQQVLDAFQIEHREQLQRIRALLLELETDDPVTRAACIDEAFRMAHSLKGGARVCDLRPAEALGHGLETMFSKVREGALALTDDSTRAISVVMDGIEDWMAALLETDSPPEPAEALRVMESLLQDDAATAARLPAPVPSDDETDEIEQQLRTAFFVEYRRYADGLMAFLDRYVQTEPNDPRTFEEAFCLAHDLRASARAAQLCEIEQTAAPLEKLFRELRNGTEDFNFEVKQTVQSALRKIDEHMTGTERDQSHPDASPQSAEAINGDGIATEKAENGAPMARSAATAEKQIETVRVRADSLDRLLQSSSQLLTESLRHDQMTREIGELKAIVESMLRERESLRRGASASFHRLDETPELRHLVLYFDSADRNLHMLSQKIRKLSLKQQRSCWSLRSHGMRIQEDIRQARMVSAHSLFQAFPKMVRDLAREEGKQVDFKLVGADVRADRIVLQALKDPVMHMLRNAVSHGIESPEKRVSHGKPPNGRVTLVVKVVGNQLQMTIQDDGSGIDLRRIAEVAARTRFTGNPETLDLSSKELAQLIFEPGFSTSASVTELAGRGMGLSVVYETVRRLQGSVQLLDDGPGTTILLSVPLSICTHRLLLVASGPHTFAIPLHSIERLVQIEKQEIETLEGAPVVMYQDRLIPIVTMAGLTGTETEHKAPITDRLSTLILKSGGRHLAVVVDAFLEERDALVQDLDAPAASVEFVGAILTEDGGAVLVLNPSYLFESKRPSGESFDAAPSTERPDERRLQVLVVDDSFTTRTLEKSILETHGYLVHVAIDGLEALDKLHAHRFDAVISDLEMPRLDGFGLLEEMKKQQELASIPVILVTSRDCPGDQQRGLDLGAEAYIVKRKFDHQDLLNIIEQVIAS